MGFEKVSKGDEAIKQECESRFTVRRQYSWHSSNKGYRRIISKVEHEDKFLRLAVVQYIVTTSDTSSLFSTPYGNGKRRQPHQRTKPSVLAKIRDMGASQSAKHIISQLEREAGDVATISSASYLPRDRQQVYNQLKKVEGRTKSRSTGPSKAPKHHEAVDVTAFRFISEKRQFVIQARSKGEQTCSTQHICCIRYLPWMDQALLPRCRGKSGCRLRYDVQAGPFLPNYANLPKPDVRL